MIKPSNNKPIINVLSEVLCELDCLHPKRFRQEESVARRPRCSNMTVKDFMCSFKKIHLNENQMKVIKTNALLL